MHGIDKISFSSDNLYSENYPNKYSMNHSRVNFIEKEELRDDIKFCQLDHDSNIMYHNEYNSPYRITINNMEQNKNNLNGSQSSIYIPKNPKIFSRRVEGRLNENKNSYIPTHNSCNSFSNQFGFNKKNLVSKRSNMSKGNSRNRNLSETTKIPTSHIEHTNNVRKFYGSTEDINTNSMLDVPLCVQEVGNNVQQHYKFMPLHSLNQDEYYLQHYVNNRDGDTLKPSPEKLIKVIQILFKCMYKTVRLVIQKIRNELDTKEFVNPNYRIPSLPNLDIPCDVCEKTEENRLRLRETKRDGLIYFEEPDTTPKFIKTLWNTLNNWMDINEKDSVVFQKKVDKKNEPEAFYKIGLFPKDENGKVELPKFEKVPKRN